jgi:ABC-type Zn2+ transport system substrate-binding protein/surface adhesin
MYTNCVYLSQVKKITARPCITCITSLFLIFVDDFLTANSMATFILYDKSSLLAPNLPDDDYDDYDGDNDNNNGDEDEDDDNDDDNDDGDDDDDDNDDKKNDLNKNITHCLLCLFETDRLTYVHIQYIHIYACTYVRTYLKSKEYYPLPVVSF